MESHASAHSVPGPVLVRVAIRNAEPGDVGPLSVLMTQLGYPTQEEDMAARLERLLPLDDCLVAVALLEDGVKGGVVGVIAACVTHAIEATCRHGFVSALSVLADHRGRGIGALLLSHAEAWLKTRGAQVCTVNSSNYRTRAHRFYLREGYLASGLRFQKSLG